jgi:predicted Rossmann-fold nucleotide-binding protein
VAHYVAVIGASRPTERQEQLAQEVGRLLGEAGAAIAVGGAYGTLSEIALALAQEVPVVGLDTWDIGGIEVAPDPATAVTRGLALAAARLGGSI